MRPQSNHQTLEDAPSLSAAAAVTTQHVRFPPLSTDLIRPALNHITGITRLSDSCDGPSYPVCLSTIPIPSSCVGVPTGCPISLWFSFISLSNTISFISIHTWIKSLQPSQRSSGTPCICLLSFTRSASVLLSLPRGCSTARVKCLSHSWLSLPSLACPFHLSCALSRPRPVSSPLGVKMPVTFPAYVLD